MSKRIEIGIVIRRPRLQISPGRLEGFELGNTALSSSAALVKEEGRSALPPASWNS